MFSQYAAPVSFANEVFTGIGIYPAEDMPDIDYLLMTHDHRDHPDDPAIDALRDKVLHVICGLGVGQYFRSGAIQRRACMPPTGSRP